MSLKSGQASLTSQINVSLDQRELEATNYQPEVLDLRVPPKWPRAQPAVMTTHTDHCASTTSSELSTTWFEPESTIQMPQILPCVCEFCERTRLTYDGGLLASCTSSAGEFERLGHLAVSSPGLDGGQSWPHVADVLGEGRRASHTEVNPTMTTDTSAMRCEGTAGDAGSGGGDAGGAPLVRPVDRRPMVGDAGSGGAGGGAGGAPLVRPVDRRPMAGDAGSGGAGGAPLVRPVDRRPMAGDAGSGGAGGTPLVRPVDRRPMALWLIEQLERGDVPGLTWVNKAAGIFQVPWLHGSHQGWTIEHDACLFLRWAKYTGTCQTIDLHLGSRFITTHVGGGLHVLMRL